MAPEAVRYLTDISTPSQIGTTIETLYVAIDKLQKAKEDCENKYQKERTELLQTAAKELQATADAARAMPKIKELQAKEIQFKEEQKAIDYMIDTINKQIDSLSDRNPEEVIKVVKKRIEELQKRMDETDAFKSEKTTLEKKKRQLELKIRLSQPLQAAEASTGGATTGRATTGRVTTGGATTRRARTRRATTGRATTGGARGTRTTRRQ